MYIYNAHTLIRTEAKIGRKEERVLKCCLELGGILHFERL
jgi:hypothetical protein